MRVPTGLATHTKSPHGLIPWDGVLEGPSFQMVQGWLGIGRWRTFIKYKLLFPLRCTQGLRKNFIILPKLQNRFFPKRRVGLCLAGAFGRGGLIFFLPSHYWLILA